MNENSPRPRGRALRRAAGGAGLVIVFSCALAGGALLHVRLAPGRRLVARSVTAVLSQIFSGRVVIEKIGSLGPDGVDGAEATVYDPEGARVLSVTGLRARASLARIALGIASGGEIRIVISRARVEHADVNFIPDENGIPSLARAFTPRPSTSGPSLGPPPKVSVWLPEVEMRTACVRGKAAGLANLDVDLANVGGSVLAGTERTSIRLRRYSLSLLAPLRATGTADTQIEIPSSSGQSLSVWSAFDGYVGEVQVDAHGSLDGRDVQLTADVVRARPDAVRALWPVWPVLDNVDLHVESAGRPPILATVGHAELGTGAADFSGSLRLGGGISLDLGVDARSIDLRSFESGAPPSAVSASGHLALEVTGERPVTGSFDAKTDPTSIVGIDVPAATVTGKIDGALVSGQATLRAPSISSDVDFAVHPGRAEGPVVVDLDWTAKVPELARVEWLAPVGRGRAAWHAKGQVTGGALDARVDADIEHFVRPGLGLEHAHVAGSVRGPLERLDLALSLDGKNLSAGPLYLPEVKASARGPLASLHLGATSEPTGAAGVRLGAEAIFEMIDGGATLRNLDLSAARGDVTLSGKVKTIEVSGDRLDLKEVAITGAGEPLGGSLSISPSELRIHASAADVDLKRLAAVLAPTMPVAGRVSFDIDADFRGKTERGHIRVRLSDGDFAGFTGIEMQAEADAVGRRFSGGAELRMGELGSLGARTVDATLMGPLLRASSWKEASGRLEIDSRLDLDRLKKTPLTMLVPAVDAGGVVYGKLLLAREELDVHQKHAPSANESPPPDADLLLWTDHLRVDIRDPAHLIDAGARPRFSSQDVDVQIGFHLEGEGEHASLTARLIDGQGIFAGLTALGDIPVEDLWRHPENLKERLMRLPMTAKLTLPGRRLDLYPGMVRPFDLEGEIEATASLTGSIRSPSIDVAVRGHGMKPASQGLTFPVDVDLQAAYDGHKGSGRLRAMRPEGVVLDARTDVEISLDALLDADPQARSSWQASGSAKLSDFPLASVAALGGSQVVGLASGTLRWDRINRDPDIQAQLEFKDLKLDRAVFPHAVAVLRIAKGGIVASANLEHVSGGGSATATARVKWTSPFVPDLDTREPLDVYLAAHDLRAAALYPVLFRGIFTYFDGRLNGTLHFHQEPEQKEVAQTVDGAFDLQEGVFQVPEVGQEFRNATAKITMTRQGEVEVTNVSANGASGRMTASGKMTMKGVSFVSGEGQVRIAKSEAVPLTLEGVSLGEAWGSLFLHAKMRGEHTVGLDVDLPTFHTDLPESSGRDIQSLGDNPDVQVGVRTPPEGFSTVLLGPPQARRSDDALRWRITLFLGQDVGVRRGRNLELVLGGAPVIDLTDEVRVSGQIEMRGGNVEVFGKRFDIEHGVGRFEGDEPSNPYVSAIARWEAPDGTRIFANFVGPLRTGVLTLRSEPARSQSEILAILLFGGTTDTAQTAQQAKSNENGEWVVGGAAVTTGLNRVLSSVTPLDITTRVTSDSQSPTPEVAIQLSPKLTAEISYRTRTPTPLENQDRTLITLDWRFRRNWSIATTVGQQSTVLDLIWRYRY